MKKKAKKSFLNSCNVNLLNITAVLSYKLHKNSPLFYSPAFNEPVKTENQPFHNCISDKQVFYLKKAQKSKIICLSCKPQKLKQTDLQ